ncbi:hypothetical protein CHUAL_009639 [Chamberlinius hualienensis]
MPITSIIRLTLFLHTSRKPCPAPVPQPLLPCPQILFHRLQSVGTGKAKHSSCLPSLTMPSNKKCCTSRPPDRFTPPLMSTSNGDEAKEVDRQIQGPQSHQHRGRSKGEGNPGYSDDRIQLPVAEMACLDFMLAPFKVRWSQEMLAYQEDSQHLQRQPRQRSPAVSQPMTPALDNNGD